jgi:hypothetical protein
MEFRQRLSKFEERASAFNPRPLEFNPRPLGLNPRPPKLNSRPFRWNSRPSGANSRRLSRSSRALEWNLGRFFRRWAEEERPVMDVSAEGGEEVRTDGTPWSAAELTRPAEAGPTATPLG